ncbi:MAG TPA: hypothetical protein VEV16_00635 [Daejeonella sp.]|nr:hypothetical protein [Daejeonella sp.]
MLHRFIAISLICTVISSNLTSFMVFAMFKLNQSYIIRELCENRAKPAMQCNGKCYLKKKLKQAEQNEQKQEQQVRKNFMQEGFVQEKKEFKFSHILLDILHLPPGQLYSFQTPSLIFHPPRV